MAVSCHYVMSLLGFYQIALGVANHPFQLCLVYMQGVIVLKCSLIMSFRHGAPDSPFMVC